jgi:hypothetical protein
MDKICSFVIILIIAYLSYDYCSTKEGLGDVQTTSGINQGYYDRGEDLTIPVDEANVDSSGQACPAVPTEGDACFYKTTMCERSDFDIDSYNFGDDSNTERTTCMRCVMGSETMPRSVTGLASIGLKNRGRTSEFARNYCDALMADCDDYYFYALGTTDFYKDCGYRGFMNFDEGIMASTYYTFMCSIMTNPIFMFIFEILKGISCPLKIKAMELERSLENAGHDVLCELCGPLPNPIPCPDHC